MHGMRTIAIDDPMGVCNCHSAALCKHGWTDLGPIWGGGAEALKYIRQGFRFPRGFDAAVSKLLWPFV